MKIIRKAGDTSNILQVFIQDSSSTVGAGLTGLAFGSAGLTAYYHKDVDTTATAITLVTMTVGTFTSSGFKEIDAANMPGWYQLCPPDAAFSSGKSVGLHLKGATNMAPLAIEVQLVGLDLQINQTGDSFARLGAPAGASHAADVAAVKADTAAVKVQTDKLTFTVANQVDSNVLDWKSATAPAMTGDAFARLGAPAGASVSADVAAVKSDTGTVLTDVNTGAGAIYTRLGAPAGASIAADIAANSTLSTGIKAKTDSLAFTSAGKVDANVLAVNGDATAAVNLQASTDAICRGTVGAASTTTSIITSAFSPAPGAIGQFIGRTVIFDANTATVALRGQATNITNSTNSATPTLTVTALTTAPASSDTFSVV